MNLRVVQRDWPDPGWTLNTAQQEHDRVLARRNRIAHMADIDPATNQRTPMPGDEATTAVTWISDLGYALSGLLDARAP